MLLISDYLALLACLLISGLCIAAVLSRARWAQALGYSLAGLVFVVHVIGAREDYLWPWIWPHPSVLMLSNALVWGPLCAVLLGLARYVPKPRDARALRFIAALVAAFGVYSAVRPLFPAPVNGQSYWEDEVLIQSTSSTCIAAAAATYLRTLGVEVDEAQAARAGLISSEGGDQLSAWRALRLLLPADYRVRIAPMSRAEAMEQDGWMLTALQYDFATGHEVAFRNIKGRGSDDSGVLVRDPIDGEQFKSWDEFEQHWLHICVWAEKK